MRWQQWRMMATVAVNIKVVLLHHPRLLLFTPHVHPKDHPKDHGQSGMGTGHLLAGHTELNLSPNIHTRVPPSNDGANKIYFTTNKTLLHSWESIQPASQKRASGQLGKVVFCGSTKVTTFQLDIIWNKSNYPLTAQGVIISSSLVVSAQHPSQLALWMAQQILI